MIRITAGEHPAISILQPALAKLLPSYPDIQVEVIVDYGLTESLRAVMTRVSSWANRLPKDMIGVRLGPDIRCAVVGPVSLVALI